MTQGSPDSLLPSLDARRVVRGCRTGMLATLSESMDGHPFGSVIDFVLDHCARPFFLISDLAEHTRNLRNDPRASLLAVRRDPPDQVPARVTLLGRALPMPPQPALTARYLRSIPAARGYLALPGFAFFRLDVERVRYVGGLGNIHWVPAGDYAPQCELPAEGEEEALATLNGEHRQELQALTQGVPCTAVGIDCDGIDLVTGSTAVRIDFETPVTDFAGACRAALNGGRP